MNMRSIYSMRISSWRWVDKICQNEKLANYVWKEPKNEFKEQNKEEKVDNMADCE